METFTIRMTEQQIRDLDLALERAQFDIVDRLARIAIGQEPGEFAAWEREELGALTDELVRFEGLTDELRAQVPIGEEW